MAADGDARKLQEDYHIEVNGIVDMTPLVPKRNLSGCIDPSKKYSKTEQSLVGIVDSCFPVWINVRVKDCVRG